MYDVFVCVMCSCVYGVCDVACLCANTRMRVCGLCAYVYVCVRVCMVYMTWYVCVNVHVRAGGGRQK